MYMSLTSTLLSYEEVDTCMSHEEEDACMSDLDIAVIQFARVSECPCCVIQAPRTTVGTRQVGPHIGAAV